MRNNRIKISVRDTGIGISSSNQEKIFHAFERLGQQHEDIEGTGIGLVVSKQLVELMGGRIGFESIEGQGTTFWFELPLAESISASNERALMDKLNKTTTAEPLNDNIKTKNILYVEDNPANRQLMTSFFCEAS